MFEVEIKGLDALIAEFDAFIHDYRGNAQRAASHVMEDMMREMKTLTPVDEGILRGTGHVVGPDWHGDTLEGAWVYGGPAATYAAVQHERTDYHHTVGQAKFITTVTDARYTELIQAIDQNLISGKE